MSLCKCGAAQMCQCWHEGVGQMWSLVRMRLLRSRPQHAAGCECPACMLWVRLWTAHDREPPADQLGATPLAPLPDSGGNQALKDVLRRAATEQWGDAGCDIPIIRDTPPDGP